MSNINSQSKVNQAYATKYCNCALPTFKKFFPNPEFTEKHEKGYIQYMYTIKNLDAMIPEIRKYQNELSRKIFKQENTLQKKFTDVELSDPYHIAKDEKELLEFNDDDVQTDDHLKFSPELFKEMCEDFIEYRDNLLKKKLVTENDLNGINEDLKLLDEMADSIRSNRKTVGDFL